jgi:hypothetical protein
MGCVSNTAAMNFSTNDKTQKEKQTAEKMGQRPALKLLSHVQSTPERHDLKPQHGDIPS